MDTQRQEDAATQPRASSGEPSERLNMISAFTIAASFWCAAGYLVLRLTEWGEVYPTFTKSVGWIAIGSFVVLIGTRGFNRASEQNKLALGLIMSLLFVSSIPFLSPALETCVFGLLFVSILTALPFTMYWFFRAARGYSLADEFVSNLERLGVAKDPVLKRRVLAYVHEFDALYGPLTARQQELMATALSLDKKDLPQEGGFGGRRQTDPGLRAPGRDEALHRQLFEGRAPVLLATLLCGLGWFTTLNPVTTEARVELAHYANIVAGRLPTAAPLNDALKPTAAARVPADPKRETADQLSTVLTPEKTPPAFAFYGAYFFSLQLLFQRYLRRDLSSRSYVGTSLRFVLSMIATWVLQFAITVPEGNAQTKVLLAAAFTFGAVPLTVFTLLGNVFRKIPLFADLLPGLHSRRRLSELDGLTMWHQARLEEEDIDNIPGMATVDLVGLMLSTRISPNRLVDWVDQAILLRHLPWDRKKDDWTELRERLESRGVRMASGLRSLWDRYGADPASWKWLDEKDGAAIAVALITACEDSTNQELIESWRGSVRQPLRIQPLESGRVPVAAE